MANHIEETAYLLGIPVIQVTNKGVANIASITVNELGISVGYTLPGEIHSIEIEGTFTKEEDDSNES